MEEGQRFSLLYLERSAPIRDSQRFRNRLAAYYFENLHDDHNAKIKRKIEKETGAEVPFKSSHFSVAGFIKSNEIRDVLDSITLIYQFLKDLTGWSRHAEMWKSFVSRVLSEENLGYKLDAKCGVHYFVDEEFERNRFSTLSILDDQKYNATKTAYEDAYRHMDNNLMDTKAAVRSMFESIEILVRQMVETKNLNRWIVENSLKEKCLSLCGEDKTTREVTGELFDGFASWVDALHNYRHGQASDEPVAPSEEVAIYVLSSGSAFLRWLAGINNNLNK